MAETTSTLSPNLHTYYQKVLLNSAESKLMMKQFVTEKMHPTGNGKDYFILRYGNVAASTTPLTEGTTPSEGTIDTNKYTVTAQGFGQYIKTTDFLNLTSIDPVMESISDRLGYTAALSLDSIIRDEIVANATANLQYAGTGNSVDNDITATEILTTRDVIKAVRVLKAGDAPTFDDGCYVWVVHSNVEMDIMSDTAAGGFIELNKYVSGLADKPLKGEIGKAYGARVVVTNNINYVANGGGVNVYRTLVLAKDSTAMSKFSKNAIQIITKQLGSGGDTDPLNQRATVGYKMYVGVKYLGGSFTNHNGASPDLAIQLRGAATNG